MTDRELMQQVLDALEQLNKLSVGENAICLPAEIDDAMETLRTRLAQPEPEPVACPYCATPATLGAVYYDQNCSECVKRMAAPPKREWQGLTDEEIEQAYRSVYRNEADLVDCNFADELEAKLKEKNNV